MRIVEAPEDMEQIEIDRQDHRLVESRAAFTLSPQIFNGLATVFDGGVL
jgi:hypothetical protein